MRTIISVSSPRGCEVVEALTSTVSEVEIEPPTAIAGGDAIAEAARWCAAARALQDGPPVMAYGTRDTAWVLVGERRRLCIERYGDSLVSVDELWERLDKFTRVPGFIGGYIGFDAVWPDSFPRQQAPGGPAVPTVYLVEPAGAIRITAGRSARPAITVLQDSSLLRQIRPEPDADTDTEALPLRPLDRDTGTFRSAVAEVIDAIRSGKASRLTLARRIDLPDDLDPLASFAAPPRVDGGAVARSFYLATDFLEMGGHSPELLGSGDLGRFVCYKLSGTGARDPGPAKDAHLRAQLLTDGKVLREHALSIEATAAALAATGAVEAGVLQLVERGGLRHLMTPLTVVTRPATVLASIVRALLPAGAQPRAAGLEMLDALEPATRAAYYGLIGLRTPDGQFEFSQVLRTLFRDRSGVHTFVGAAVTDGSTVDGECEETRLKLDDVVAVRRRILRA